jgi:hypothetical protein
MTETESLLKLSTYKLVPTAVAEYGKFPTPIASHDAAACATAGLIIGENDITVSDIILIIVNNVFENDCIYFIV